MAGVARGRTGFCKRNREVACRNREVGLLDKKVASRDRGVMRLDTEVARRNTGVMRPNMEVVRRNTESCRPNMEVACCNRKVSRRNVESGRRQEVGIGERLHEPPMLAISAPEPERTPLTRPAGEGWLGNDRFMGSWKPAVGGWQSTTQTALPDP